METRRRKAARLSAKAVPSLAEQPADVLAQVGAELADALSPAHLVALASTCRALELALRAAVAELKETRLAVSALLRKCSNPRKTEYTLEQAAAGDVDVIFGGGKGLDAADARLMARCCADTCVVPGPRDMYQPPACCACRWHRAACPGRPLPCVRPTRTSLRRATRKCPVCRVGCGTTPGALALRQREPTVLGEQPVGVRKPPARRRRRRRPRVRLPKQATTRSACC